MRKFGNVRMWECENERIPPGRDKLWKFEKFINEKISKRKLEILKRKSTDLVKRKNIIKYMTEGF